MKILYFLIVFMIIMPFSLAIDLNYSQTNFTNIYNLNENKSYQFNITNIDNDTAENVNLFCSYCSNSFNPTIFNLSSSQSQLITFNIKTPETYGFFNNTIKIYLGGDLYDELEANLEVVNKTDKTTKYLECEVLPNTSLACIEISNITQTTINVTEISSENFFILTEDTFKNLIESNRITINETIFELSQKQGNIYQNAFKIINLLESKDMSTWFKIWDSYNYDIANSITNLTGLSIAEFQVAYGVLATENKVAEKLGVEQIPIEFGGQKFFYPVSVKYIASSNRLKEESEREKANLIVLLALFVIIVFGAGKFIWNKYREGIRV